MTVQAFRSRLDEASQRLGTFSYLPPMDRDAVARQITYALAQGWTCSVEHVEPSRAGQTYWYLWKLPFFGALGAGDVLAELDACRAASPGDHVRLVAYDSKRQTLGLAFVVHRAGGTP